MPGSDAGVPSELEALRNHKEYLDELEQNGDALPGSLEGVTPKALDTLASEERH